MRRLLHLLVGCPVPGPTAVFDCSCGRQWFAEEDGTGAWFWRRSA